jgi:ribonuclease J
MTSSFKITPLGGVGQIGSNITYVEYNNEAILVDAGILFPSENFFDIHYLIPNLDDLPVTPSKLFITHGHEDHIGAILHVLMAFPDIEVYAPLFAKELIIAKLKEARNLRSINVYTADSVLSFQSALVYPIRVNHSIPDTYGLYFLDPEASKGFFFVSDFKIDFKTPYEPPFDFERLLTVSKQAECNLLLCDSTNITSSVLHTPSEIDLVPSLEKILAAPGRLFATFFASNVHRLQTLIDLAAATKRKVVLYGGSTLKYAHISLEHGFLNDKHNVIRAIESIDPADSELIIVLSGCQADFKSTFRRVAYGDDSRFKLFPTDRFIISSKAIPGNEKAISIALNKIAEAGVAIFTADKHLIHASGHPGREDIKLLIEKFSPEYLIPIHGESLFLNEHIQFIKASFPKVQPLLLYNFDTFNFSDLSITRGVPKEPILIHGNRLPIERSAISSRRKLATSGAVFISVFSSTSKPAIHMTTSGLPDIADQWNSELEGLIIDQLRRKDRGDLTESIRVLVRQFYQARLGYRPIAFVHRQ